MTLTAKQWSVSCIILRNHHLCSYLSYCQCLRCLATGWTAAYHVATQRQRPFSFIGVVIVAGKDKGAVPRMGRRLGTHLPVLGYRARMWIDHCDAWLVWRQTYSYLPSCRASPPFGRYQIILLGDRATWLWTSGPELLLDQPGVELATVRS